MDKNASEVRDAGFNPEDGGKSENYEFSLHSREKHKSYVGYAVASVRRVTNSEWHRAEALTRETEESFISEPKLEHKTSRIWGSSATK